LKEADKKKFSLSCFFLRIRQFLFKFCYFCIGESVLLLQFMYFFLLFS